MTKHTPGPWHRNIKPASKYPTIWAGRNTHVASISPGAPRRSGNGCTMSEDEQEANICLITAAPDLLEALAGYLVLGVGKCTIGRRQADAALAAIRKATGEC